jgi:hypothetical protein
MPDSILPRVSNLKLQFTKLKKEMKEGFSLVQAEAIEFTRELTLMLKLGKLFMQ